MGKRFSYESTQKRMKDILEHPERHQSIDIPIWNKALDKVSKDIQESYPGCLDEDGLPKRDYKVPISMIFAIIAANYDNDGNGFYAEDKNLDMDKL